LNPDIKNSYKVSPFSNLIYLENNKWLFYSKTNHYVFDETNPVETSTINNNGEISIFDAQKYKDEFLFFSTLNNGLWLYNWKNKEFQLGWKNESKKFSLSTNAVRQLYLSSSGYLWLSQKNKGIDYAFIKKRNFKNPFFNILKDDIDVTSIVESKNEEIWVSTRRNGVFVFSLKGEFIHHFKDLLSKTELWQIIEHGKYGILGITTENIYKYDLNNKNILNIIPKSDSITFRFISKIHPERYLISSNLGIIEIVETTSDKYSLKFCEEFVDYKEYSFTQMYQTQNNKVFIPYSATELWIYKATRKNLRLTGKNDTCNLEFFGFCESRKKTGVVWAATSKGLKEIDQKNTIKSVFIDNSELANRNVYGIVEDDNGNLWITTNKGLWKYNLNLPNDKPIHFEEADGLSGELFSLYHSSLYASDGTIWLGNNKGLVKFHPDSIKIHKEIPKLHLDEILVNDTKSFKKNIEDGNLVLNHNQNTLTFDIKAINLYKAKRNKIYYQLEGYDKDEETLQINNGEKIRYTKIKPGNYVLNAYGEDANGHKSEMKPLLKLEINPPWWKTLPFYILYALLSGLTIFSLLSWRENNIIEKQIKKAAVEKLKAKAKLEEETKKREIEKLEAQALLKEQAQKTAIAKLETQILEVEMIALRAQMNPHFLFNSLNSIKSLILKTKEKEASEYLSKFSTLLRSILNNSEKQKIKLSEEIEALRLYIELEALRFASDFNYQIQIDKTIDSSFIRIPPLLLQPFVENAIWHGLLPKTSSHAKLNINIIRQEDFLFFEIEDNGVGRKNECEQPEKENQKPMGINITRKRIEILHKENDIEIIDLVDNNQSALGTKVLIKLYAPE